MMGTFTLVGHWRTLKLKEEYRYFTLSPLRRLSGAWALELECAIESPRGLVKAQVAAPPPLLLIPWVTGGYTEFSF